jgi:hypothetical protein
MMVGISQNGHGANIQMFNGLIKPTMKTMCKRTKSKSQLRTPVPQS